MENVPSSGKGNFGGNGRHVHWHGMCEYFSKFNQTKLCNVFFVFMRAKYLKNVCTHMQYNNKNNTMSSSSYKQFVVVVGVVNQ